jgi:hypothetical protein
VPRLLFPASFTRVGAQTVFPAPWTICGEAALITSNYCSSKSRRDLSGFSNLQKRKNLSFFFIIFSYGCGSSPRLASFCLFCCLAQGRSSRHGCDPEGSRRAEQQLPRRTALGRKLLQPRAYFFFHIAIKLAHLACVPFTNEAQYIYEKGH